MAEISYPPEKVKEKVIIAAAEKGDMSSQEKRTMPVCLTPQQMAVIEEYAKAKGMLNVSQAIEELVE